MDAPHNGDKSGARRTGIFNLIAPTIFPLAIAVFAIPGTLFIQDQFHLDAMPMLVGWCVVLVGLAAWLNRVLFQRVITVLPFIAAILVVLSVWLWQRQAFTTLVPKTGLTWGYFLTPAGAKARFWVLVCPFWAGVACLSFTCLLALVIAWRAGHRLSVLCLLPWWLAAFVVFALPSVFLDGQGNASIFI